MKKGKNFGRVVFNGVRPEPHELEIILFFTNLGKNIEIIPPTLTPCSKNADFVMDRVAWEAKSPRAATKIVVECAFHKALRQSCNVIIDLRRAKGDECDAIRHLQKCFAGSKKVKRLFVIAKHGDLIDFRKRSC